jgi:hypothetical protein
MIRPRFGKSGLTQEVGNRAAELVVFAVESSKSALRTPQKISSVIFAATIE